MMGKKYICHAILKMMDGEIIEISSKTFEELGYAPYGWTREIFYIEPEMAGAVVSQQVCFHLRNYRSISTVVKEVV